MGKIAIRGFDEKMIVVCHEAVGVADPVAALIDVLEGVQEVLTVLFVLEYGLLLVSTRGHVIDCAGILYAERAGHEKKIAKGTTIIKPQDLTLKVPPGTMQTRR